MQELRPYLEAHKEEIRAYVEARNDEIPKGDNAYANLVRELRDRLLIQDYQGNQKIDKAHLELAQAIIQALWCGWLSQAKTKPKGTRLPYPKDYPERFEEAIMDAFRVGIEYASVLT